jgi:hypothetical protein
VIVSLVVLAAVVLPGLRTLVEGVSGDGFPLSTYPMFTGDPGRYVELPTVVAVGRDGHVERLSPQEIAGTDQVIQAWEAVRRAVARGSSTTHALCREVAARIGRDVEVVVERYDTRAWARDPDAEPLERRPLARCRP